jgi:ATP-dependent DNA helicase RecG
MRDISVRYIKGVGPSKEASFNELGVYTVRDLLYYFPFRYEDRRSFRKISELKEEEASLVKGVVFARNLKKMPYFLRSKKVKSIFEVVLGDDKSRVNCVWFNQTFLSDLIKVGMELIVFGKPRFSGSKLQFVAPEYEFVKKEDSLNLGRIVGVYPLKSNFPQKFMRKITYSALSSFKNDFSEFLPFYIRKDKDFPNIRKSLNEIHFPSSWGEVEKAREKFIFEELFFSQILVYLRKAKRHLQKSAEFKVEVSLLDKVKNNLPFKLTSGQEKSIFQITRDLEKPYPMHRLLQGDVGCGKTIVSAFACAVCLNSGWQAAFMVPTEVLAHQHKETLGKVFKGLGYTIEVISSSLPKAKIKKIYSNLEQGEIDIIVGTHALIQEDVKFKKMGLVIIDEQHKFGVAQRVLLPKKSGYNPHCLVMSATPIPRSLALSLYGDLDLSVIKELPSGRIPPQNLWVKEDKRGWVYDFLKTKLKENRQVYIVYPLIEESEDQDLKSLEVMYEKLVREFSHYSVGMFHGRMKGDKKLEVIKKFRENKINMLVSTTVVEVGVSVENATVMVVENPERFGLAQLHQLRGRIQRSSHQPYFILISKDELSPIAEKRLGVISNTTDGFKIAEEDLIIRGPGDFFGHLQHGIPNLKIADPLRDLEILKQARLCAYNVIKNDSYLEKPVHRSIREHLTFWFQK